MTSPRHAEKGLRFIVMNLRTANADKSLFRQCRRNIHKEIIHRLFNEIDVVEATEKVVGGLKGEFGDELEKLSGYV